MSWLDPYRLMAPMIKTTTANRKTMEMSVMIMPDTITTMMDTPCGARPLLQSFVSPLVSLSNLTTFWPERKEEA
jgi:hypothetical protein